MILAELCDLSQAAFSGFVLGVHIVCNDYEHQTSSPKIGGVAIEIASEKPSQQ
jgi:hypothetical protein